MSILPYGPRRPALNVQSTLGLSTRSPNPYALISYLSTDFCEKA